MAGVGEESGGILPRESHILRNLFRMSELRARDVIAGRFRIEDPATSPLRARFAELYLELRRSRGASERDAVAAVYRQRDILQDVRLSIACGDIVEG